MKVNPPISRLSCRWVGRNLAVASLGAALVASGYAQARYSVTDLGVLPGGINSWATGINAKGQIIGVSDLPGGVSHGFLYDHGQMLDLLPGDNASCRPNSINALGDVVGSLSRKGSAIKGVLWHSGAIVPLSGSYNVTATSINDKGWIVGNSYRIVRFRQYSNALLWRPNGNGGYSESFIGDPNAVSWASAINNTPRVAGHVLNGAYEATVWSAWDSMTIPGPGMEDYVTAMNASGQLAGYFLGNDDMNHPFFSDGVGISPLPEFDGGGEGKAEAIDRAGNIVGTATTAEFEPHAVIWKAGKLFDLNSMIPSNSEWILSEATGINDRGQIVGFGWHNGHTRAFLLSIAPTLRFSPSTLVGSTYGQGTITLPYPAGSGGVTIQISSGNPTVAAPIPASVKIPEGSTSATFYLSTHMVGETTRVEISIGAGETAQKGTVTVLPLLKDLQLSANAVKGGSESPTATITLATAAPAGGVTLSLTSSRPDAASVPTSIFVPSGASSATFTVTTATVAQIRRAVISANLMGKVARATLTISP